MSFLIDKELKKTKLQKVDGSGIKWRIILSFFTVHMLPDKKIICWIYETKGINRLSLKQAWPAYLLIREVATICFLIVPKL